MWLNLFWSYGRRQNSGSTRALMALIIIILHNFNFQQILYSILGYLKGLNDDWVEIWIMKIWIINFEYCNLTRDELKFDLIVILCGESELRAAGVGHDSLRLQAATWVSERWSWELRTGPAGRHIHSGGLQPELPVSRHIREKYRGH